MTSKYQLPFDEYGNMLTYPLGVSKWRDNKPFTTKLTYDTYSRGQSSAVAWWKDESGTHYPMFMSDLDLAIKHSVKGELYGEFIGVKKGENYGIKLAKWV